MQKRRRFQVSNKIKISKTVRTFLISLSIAIFAFGLGNLFKSINSEKEIVKDTKETYKYSNNFVSNAKINLKSNEYIDKNEMVEGQAYLSDLISDIDMNINYKYNSSKQAEVKYNYKIEAIVKAVYADTTNSYDVLNKNEVLKESQDKTVNSEDLIIDENIKVNYSKYHKMIKDFKQTMGISVDSFLYIRLTVDTTTYVNSKEVKDQYVANYKITLGDKIAVINGKENDEDTKFVEDDAQTEKVLEISFGKVISSLFVIVISIIIFRLILVKTEELKVVKNEFKFELNKIMKSYNDKIIEIQDLKQIDIDHATAVKDITQLRKLADEEALPIYCYIEEDRKAYFIVTMYKSNYIYVLK